MYFIFNGNIFFQTIFKFSDNYKGFRKANNIKKNRIIIIIIIEFKYKQRKIYDLK